MPRYTSGASSGGIKLPLLSLRSTPGNPNGSGSNTRVMCGLAIPYTPTLSTQLLVTASFEIHGSLANTNPEGSLNYGTGVAPVNGAAEAGTEVDQWKEHFETSGVVGVAFFHVVQASLIKGLAIGIPIWLDLTEAIDAGTVTLSSIVISILEC